MRCRDDSMLDAYRVGDAAAVLVSAVTLMCIGPNVHSGIHTRE
jgi:hypothetical protein